MWVCGVGVDLVLIRLVDVFHRSVSISSLSCVCVGGGGGGMRGSGFNLIGWYNYVFTVVIHSISSVG